MCCDELLCDVEAQAHAPLLRGGPVLPGPHDHEPPQRAELGRREPDAAFRSNFIVGYPGETEDDHDELLAFVEEAQLDWCGFFSFSSSDFFRPVPRYSSKS